MTLTITNNYATTESKEDHIFFHLIQTGQIEKAINSPDIVLGYGDNKFVHFNYMGSAEYEFGASRLSFRYIMENWDEYELIETYLQNTAETPFYIFCKKDKAKLIQDSIAHYSRKGNDRGLKEPCYLYTHFIDNSQGDIEMLKWRRTHNNFWWDFEHHWMGFFGAVDRVNAFKRAMNNDRAEYLKSKNQPTYM